MKEFTTQRSGLPSTHFSVADTGTVSKVAVLNLWVPTPFTGVADQIS